MRLLETQPFVDWLAALADTTARGLIAKRLARLANDNPGDARSVGEGVSELRIHFGPGYQVYYVRKGADLILVLGGGDKSTQSADIRRAIVEAASWSGDDEA